MKPDQNKTILIVDDDPQIRLALSEIVERFGYSPVASPNGEDAISKLQESFYNLIITDMKMPKMDGITFIKEVRRNFGDLPILVMTGFGTIENAVNAIKEGATDYLLKPFSLDTLKNAIDSIIMRFTPKKEIITADPEMQRITGLAKELASSDITVLVYGESGTGKELIARFIHGASRRADKPFVAVNCAAIPENLLESELFGHEKGAFTGAAERKKGKFELASGGTILLDEIGEIPLTLQAKLLRVLQEKEIDRVGGKEPIPIAVRVIATTNRDLFKECNEGRFREDLYYRLNVFPIKVPPLRERPRDIALLAAYFLEKFTSLAGKDIQGFSDEAIEILKGREWRGNVRELENVIQRAVFLCKGSQIEARDFLLETESYSNGANGKANQVENVIKGSMDDMEKELILQTLKEVKGNKTKAAKILGVSVRTIRNKLKKYGQDFPGEEDTVN